MHKSLRYCRPAFRSIVAAIGAIGLAASPAPAVEQVVKNDSLSAGSTGTIQAGFDPGESAASWLTSPCAGNIVAVQVFWRSTTAGAPQSLEDSIKIFAAGSFPVPGAELASVDGPVMTDGVINEFRFLDENQTIPLSVPVTSGQIFVVSFKFLEDPDPFSGPSVVNDVGCQAGKNAIDATGLGWFSSCLLGVGGDWVIRAVVDCGAGGGGPGSVPNGGDTAGQPLQIARAVGGDLVLTWGASCSTSDDDYEIYEGFLGAYYSHFAKICSTAGLRTASFAPDMFSRYYLVVPSDGTQEGSYGRNSDGNERPAGGGACHARLPPSCPGGP